MSGKQSTAIIAGLILLNSVTVLYFTFGTDRKGDTAEIVASVGNKEISQTAWINELKTMHGKDTLTTMINEEVLLQLAHEHRLAVSEDELKAESSIQQVLYGANSNSFDYIGEEDFKKKLKLSILLEKFLTKDVFITDEEVNAYYKNNKSLQEFSDLYRISHIVVPKEKEANSITKELKAGKSFANLVGENPSKYTADIYGDLGYISLNAEVIPEEYKKAAGALGSGEWSQPIKLEEGYAILYVHDRIEKSELSFDKLKSALKRKVAMEQMNIPVSTEIFWEKYNVDWIYEK